MSERIFWLKKLKNRNVRRTLIADDLLATSTFRLALRSSQLLRALIGFS